MEALRTGKSVSDVVAGIFNPCKKDYVWLSINAIPQSKPGEDEPYQVFVTLHDITERKKVADALCFQSEVLAHMSEGVNLVRASDLTITFTNERFDEMFGYASGELNGKHVSILNDSSDRAAEETAREISNDLNETGSWRGEVRNVRKNGTRLWTSVCVSAYNATLWRVCSLPPSGRVS
jgi:PAS domain S-box-containing protein